MNRRQFFRKVGLLCAIPFVPKFLIPKDELKPIILPLNYNWKTYSASITISRNKYWNGNSMADIVNKKIEKRH
jgi:hypothetical protein